MNKLFVVIMMISGMIGCESTTDIKPGPGNSDDSGSGGDGDGDGDSDGGGGGDGDSDGDTDVDSGTSPAPDYSYLWVANTAEGTVSKIATRETKEVARYETCSYGNCDPSRTSVNIYGDMVVTGRRQLGYDGVPWTLEGNSMVTKISAYESGCDDRNNNGKIETSSGPSNVLPYGDDECVLWSTDLEGNIGARGTAWDGVGDPATGKGGHIWVGTCDRTTIESHETATVYVINGDTGNIEDKITVDSYCLYGAASDGESVWFIDILYPTKSGSNPSSDHYRLTRIDIETHKVSYFKTNCAYGLTIDANKRIWTSGYSADYMSDCVARFNPATNELVSNVITEQKPFSWGNWLRGLSVGIGQSAGYVWIAQTNGTLHKIDMNTLEKTAAFDIESSLFVDGAQKSHLIGTAIDFDGYIWAISQVGDTAYKINPSDGSYEKVKIGDGPYTYSDMTGIQLQNAILVE